MLSEHFFSVICLLLPLLYTKQRRQQQKHYFPLYHSHRPSNISRHKSQFRNIYFRRLNIPRRTDRRRVPFIPPRGTAKNITLKFSSGVYFSVLISHCLRKREGTVCICVCVHVCFLLCFPIYLPLI